MYHHNIIINMLCFSCTCKLLTLLAFSNESFREGSKLSKIEIFAHAIYFFLIHQILFYQNRNKIDLKIFKKCRPSSIKQIALLPTPKKIFFSQTLSTFKKNILSSKNLVLLERKNPIQPNVNLFCLLM